MIRVESIEIKEFRGIRDLTLDFAGKNFGICGPNGTGKSGVVDALEFVLTGEISRLSGEGSGEISLTKHAPHVDSRNNPKKARVIAKVSIPSLAKTFTIERNAKTPGQLLVTPNLPEAVNILRQIEAHPEFVLSRRELIRYVLATPGKRAEEVQALLHLDQVAQVRSILQRIANGCESPLPQLHTAVQLSRESLQRALEIPELTSENILTAANTRRSILGLPSLTELTTKTSLRDGMAAPAAAKPQRILKTQALADIKAAHEVLEEIASASTVTRVAEIAKDISELANDPAVIADITTENFYAIGLKLIQDETCPFCDNPWEQDELKKRIEEKLKHLKKIATARKAAQWKIAPLIETLRKVEATIDTLLQHAALATPPVVMDAARNYRETCEFAANKLTLFLPIKGTLSALENFTLVPKLVLEEISALEKVVAAIPEPTKQEAARDWLTLAQERLEVSFETRRKEKVAKEQAKAARKISDIYAKVNDDILTGIYADVEKRFASLYRFVNRDDESTFAAKLTPSFGKLGFGVDFYGRGFFPPGAYHSEGHQDSMGVCLYLALMRHLYGTGFTFAVLDDVLMSVDAGHRREVCALLKKEFPDTQFILTTHDPIWLRHMRTQGLITNKAGMQFKKWDVNSGPTLWDDRDVWAEIADYLKANDVRSAAALLREYLEYSSTELCDALKAPVEYRADAHHQLGELLPPAISRLRKLYTKAKDAANSWGYKELVEQISTRAEAFNTLAAASNVEQWQVNVSVHYNSWANLTKQDFAPVVKAFEELLAGFRCSDCTEYLWVSPERETATSLRCTCGKININLCSKAA